MLLRRNALAAVERVAGTYCRVSAKSLHTHDVGSPQPSTAAVPALAGQCQSCAWLHVALLSLELLAWGFLGAVRLLLETLKPSANAIPSLLLRAVSGRCNNLLRSVAGPKEFPFCSVLVLGALRAWGVRSMSVCTELADTERAAIQSSQQLELAGHMAKDSHSGVRGLPGSGLGGKEVALSTKCERSQAFTAVCLMTSFLCLVLCLQSVSVNYNERLRARTGWSHGNDDHNGPKLARFWTRRHAGSIVDEV